MPQIRRIRKRKPKLPRHLDDDLPVIDAAAVKAQLSSLVARWTVYGICLGLVFAVAFVYLQVVSHSFIALGDKAWVYGNPLVTSGLNPGAIARVFNPLKVDHDTCGFYSPLTMVSHMVDWVFSNQLDDKAAGNHHLVNMLLHGISVILLFLTLRLVTGAIWRSAFVAGLFAIHPLQVESVAWVSQRGDVLCGLFFILAIGAYIRYVYRPWSVVRYGTVLLFFALGLLSQPAMVAFPIVLLLLDYWPLSRYSQPVSANARGPFRQDFPSVFLRLLTEKIPFFALSFATYMATLNAQRHVESSLDTVSFPQQVSNALYSCLTYLRRTFYPRGLTVFYTQGSAPKLFVEMLLAFALVLLVSAAAFFLRKKLPYLAVGWFWFLAMLAPSVGWGEGGLFAGSDHFGYLPLLGIYFIIAWGSWDLCRFLPKRGWFATAGMILILGALMVAARIQCSRWYNGISLWSYALQVNPGNYMAHDNLGNALVENGDTAHALDYYTKALSLNPNYAEAEDDFGMVLVQRGKPGDAIPHYLRALNIRPHYAEACIDLGEALVEKGAYDDAITAYKKALEIRPGYADAHYNLGLVYAHKGSAALPQAVDEFKKAVEIRPYYAEAHFNLGIALSQPGPLQNLPGAISHFREALDLHPNYPEADYFLALVYYQKGDLDNSMAHLQKALAVRPNYEEAHFYLGHVFVDAGRPDEAIEQYQKALEIGPHYGEAYNEIANIMYKKNEFGKAIDNYEKALELKPDFLMARNNLAWLLSTCPNPDLRDGKRAVDLVEKEIQKERQLALGKDPLLLRTLAAAYAQAGNFPDAVKTAQEALDEAKLMNNPGITEGLQREIKLYESGSSYRDSH